MLTAIVALAAFQSSPVPYLSDTLSWRCVGPFRGGRTVGACGVPSQPFTFYMGVNNGGVWKTTDAGRTWKPIFDDQPTGSIGDVMVAPSNPNIIYVGSGEGLQRPDLSTGNGMYKSGDAGKTWKHIGLEDALQIGGISIDPKNPAHVLVAALGHPYGPNKARGVYQTKDGGKSWSQVLNKGEDVGAIQVTFDPNDPKVAHADMWEARQGPWENGQWQGPGSGLYKSTDGGDHWAPIGQGLPTFAKDGLGRIGFGIAPSNSKILYAAVDAANRPGLYRSDDAGKTWKQVNSERRLISRGSDFADVKVHPNNPNIVFLCDTSFYRSNDGGKTFTCIKGSPGGDDYHRAWINPDNPDIILTAADQGAAVSLNGGETWSSWYNQPTAQLYHVTADNLFPYSLYGGQQESGSAMVSSRGNDGQLTFREWHPAGGDEYAYLAPDPLNGRYVYGGRVNRYDKVTSEIVNLRPAAPHRTLRTAPLVFSQADPKQLFFGANILFRTSDGGKTWDTLSPDLSRETWEIPRSVGKYTKSDLVTRRGVIYTVAPSPREVNVIWCGTDDGLLWVTNDAGKNWENVTRGMLSAWSKVSLMDAGHFDTATAYAAINRIRLDDQKPHILRTHDAGKSWQEIVKGLPDGPVNVVREDPIRPGLLYCGTEIGVFYSLDDGDTWNALRLNLPATSVRDLIVKDNDLCIATHGRGFWILDNISLLRSATITQSHDEFFPPAPVYLLERNTNSDTPLPQDEPLAKNPPNGAILDYRLAKHATKVQIEILDENNEIVRVFSSDDPAVLVDPKVTTVMPGWAKPPQVLKKSAGFHRFIWDLRRSPTAAEGGRGGGLPISAIWGNTPFGPQGAMVGPGAYRVMVRVDGGNITRMLEVKADPRK